MTGPSSPGNSWAGSAWRSTGPVGGKSSLSWSKGAPPKSSTSRRARTSPENWRRSPPSPKARHPSSAGHVTAAFDKPERGEHDAESVPIYVAPRAGFEPALTAPEAVALSPELTGLVRGQRLPGVG